MARARISAGSVPKYNVGGSSGGGNPLQTMMMAQMMLPQKEATKSAANLQEESQSISNVKGQVQGLRDQNIPLLPGTKFVREGIDVPIVREFSVEETKALSGSDALAEQIGYIYGQMDKPGFANKWIKATGRLGGGPKGEIMGMPLSFGDAEAMKLSHSVQEMQNRLLYLRSGAQINENEFKRLSKALPSMSDISDFSDPTFGTLRKKLDDNLKDAMNIKGRIQKGSEYNSLYWEDEIPVEIKEQLQADYRKQQSAAQSIASDAPMQATPETGGEPSAPGMVGLADSPLPGAGAQGDADPLDEWRKAFLQK